MDEDEEHQKVKKLKGKQISEEEPEHKTWTGLLSQVSLKP